MTLPSEEAIDKVERAFPAIWTRTGCEDWLKGLYVIDVEPLLARIAELEKYLKEWADGSVQCTVDNHGYRLGKFVNVYDKLAAERDRLKEENEKLVQLVALYEGEGSDEVPEETEWKQLAVIPESQRTEEQKARLTQLARTIPKLIDSKLLRAELEEARKAFKLLQERCKERE